MSVDLAVDISYPNTEEVEALDWLEANCPENWDEEARKELGL